MINSMLAQFIDKHLVSVGVNKNTPPEDAARIKIINRMAVFIFIFVIIYFLVEYAMGIHNPFKDGWTISNFINLGMVLYIFPVLLLNRLGYYKLAGIALLCFIFLVFLANAYYLKSPYRTEIYFFAMGGLLFIILRDQKWLLLLSVLFPVGYFLVAQQVYQTYPDLASSEISLAMRVAFAFVFFFFTIYFLQKEAFTYQEQVELKNEQLLMEKEEMEKMNFTKDKIFSIISHDLRSPIASLQSLMSLVNQDAIGEEDFKKATKGLEKQVAQLSSTLDELLTWSKAQLHGINPEPTEIYLREAIMQVISTLRASARFKKIIITTHLESDLKVYCDPNMLHSILTNFISNAVKFTPVGGAIAVFAEEVKNEQVQIKIEDTGIGISKENIKKVLNPSVLFTTRGTNNEKGTGLGIAMSAEFIQKNNGKLDIQSEDGKGSSFIFTLPMIKKDILHTEDNDVLT